MTNTFFTWIKIVISAVCGIIAAFFDKYGILITAVITAIVIDFITGLVKAKMNGGWSSKTASKGFWKKIALLVALTFGIFLDFVVPAVLTDVGIVLPFKLPFALVISCYIVINECISIAENLYVINPDTMPNWIVKLLKIAKKEIEEKVEDSTNIKIE